ncbi:hypothetical protein HOL63_02280 [Candidatus Peregrinibacteria bacterium]|jgi:hypothetical protein|nr:hypothetical protein [Candidatus Peregrinibacteria bacterium]MBT5468706.1 hypothetical protein [Candidatus Peregrinibacteria bacterium]MBT7337389.1 hypothetical protein [Candidatus Peregrinibacteria bacterium]
MFDPMADLAGDGISGEEMPKKPAAAPRSAAPSRPPRSGGGAGGSNRSYADEVHSVTIHARQRTFYVDLKKSDNGKFFKLSEKSRGGQKITIMFDSEDLDKFIDAFQEMKAHI